MKWVIQHWPCMSSCRCLPVLALEFLSNLVCTQREGSTFQWFYSWPKTKEKTCYISTAGRDCGWSVFKEGLDHTYRKKGRNILLHRFNRSLVSDCPESVQHNRFIWGSLVRFCSVNAAPCAPKKLSVQEPSTLTSVHMHPTGPYNVDLVYNLWISFSSYECKTRT